MLAASLSEVVAGCVCVCRHDAGNAIQGATYEMKALSHCTCLYPESAFHKFNIKHGNPFQVKLTKIFQHSLT
jgi:hypothetical protein